MLRKTSSCCIHEQEIPVPLCNFESYSCVMYIFLIAYPASPHLLALVKLGFSKGRVKSRKTGSTHTCTNTHTYPHTHKHWKGGSQEYSLQFLNVSLALENPMRWMSPSSQYRQEHQVLSSYSGSLNWIRNGTQNHQRISSLWVCLPRKETPGSSLAMNKLGRSQASQSPGRDKED